MVFKLALRNLYRHPRQTFTVGSLLMVGIALLFVGNSVFDGTEAGIEESFISSFTAHFSIRSRSDVEFSIFGDQTPVIGELFKMPTLAPYPDIRSAVETLPGVESVTSLVSGLALLEYGTYRAAAPLFGVEPDTYLRTFPGIQVKEGRFLRSGERGVVLPEGRIKQMEASIGQKVGVGAVIQFTVADGITFRIRSAPLVGIIQYPLRNDTLDSIVLVDPTTVRELYNYLIGGDSPAMAKSTSTAPMAVHAPATSSGSSSIDALFEEAEPDRQVAAKGVEREAIEQELSEALRAPRPAVDEGAWNFLLVRKDPHTPVTALKRSLEQTVQDRQWEVEVLNWRQTAGTSALFLYWMRTIFNIGFLVVAVASLIILMDTLIMSVLERVREIGTLRALGASEAVIRKLFLTETTLLAAGAGLLGVGFGIGITLYLQQHPFRLENPFLIQLFGGSALLPRITMSRTILSWLTAIGMGLLGWIYPVRIALRVQPRIAMERRF
ncbi:MAG: FtsX-like permease family protein [Spirochaetes bacterium]|nr:FtsX-like permease family protein [Spirochaetota bacterium]